MTLHNGFTEKQLEGYYRKEPVATDRAILSFLRDSRNPRMVVFGTKAVNAYLPSWLDRETEDWDIMSADKAEEMAKQLESKLDAHYGGDFFGVEPALHPSTFRVRSKVTGVVVADISLRDKVVAFRRMRGVNYATLDFLEAEAVRVLGEPDKAFRHKKDKDTLQRISVYKRLRRRRAGRTCPGERYIDEVPASVSGLRY